MATYFEFYPPYTQRATQQITHTTRKLVLKASQGFYFYILFYNI